MSSLSSASAKKIQKLQLYYYVLHNFMLNIMLSPIYLWVLQFK